MVLLKPKCIYFCTVVSILSDTPSKNMAGFMVLLFIVCDRVLVEIQIYFDLKDPPVSASQGWDYF